MATSYSREFLVEVYISRFLNCCTIERLVELEQNAFKLYDRVGKTEFRKYADVTPERIKEYKNG